MKIIKSGLSNHAYTKRSHQGEVSPYILADSAQSHGARGMIIVMGDK